MIDSDTASFKYGILSGILQAMKIMIRLLTGIVLALLMVVAVVLGPYVLRVHQFAASPDDGYYADFYLYVSPAAREIYQTAGIHTQFLLVEGVGHDRKPYRIIQSSSSKKF